MITRKNGITTAKAAAVIVALVIVTGAGVYYAATSSVSQATKTVTATSTSTSTAVSTATSVSTATAVSTSTTTSTSVSTLTTTVSSTSTSTSTSHTTPSTFTYETAETISYLDPSVSFFSYDYNILQNAYENLLWWNGTCGTCVIPWLAQSYTSSPDLKTYTFTLRSGIQFADGEPLNSTAVYFAENRLLLEDGSTPVGHGTQASFLLQQLLNNNLSTFLCACTQKYNQQYVNNVLAENFVQITGPLTFTVHVMQPNSAFAFIMAGDQDSVPLAPNYVMQHDLALWTASTAGYKLPYTTLTGTMMNKINQYFADMVATCDSGSTPSGCGATYLNTSTQGSLAGTGPYTIQSFNAASNAITLVSNPNFWGGPYQFSGGQKIVPKIQTVVFKYVPDQTTREVDLQNAAKSGQAMSIDVENTNIYDIADRRAWLSGNTLNSIIPGVSIYGPAAFYSTLFIHWVQNVTNPLTAQFYKFQPFADRRLRLAFSDSVNMSQINNSVNNKLGLVALNVNPPGLPPAGSYNPSIKPAYSYNPDAVQSLLLDAMMHPLKQFRFTNGTLAKPGFFNNTFGCATLTSSGTCAHPVPQTIQLFFPTGDTVDEAIYNQIAGTINNVSATYNMALTASVVPVPAGQLLVQATSIPSHVYSYAFGWIDDYPWVLDFLGPMYAPAGTYTGPDGYNLPQQAVYYQQAVSASSRGDIAGIIAASNAMSQLSNKEVQYLWTFYPFNFFAITSNVQGFSYNPSLSTAAGGGVGPEYFATLY